MQDDCGLNILQNNSGKDKSDDAALSWQSVETQLISKHQVHILKEAPLTQTSQTTKIVRGRI